MNLRKVCHFPKTPATRFTAFAFVRHQFLELMDEWYGSDTYQDEKLEMTRLFEERLGEESAIDKSLYRELREKHPDAVILFRLGEFYEIHGEEAEMAADVLGLPVTRTNDGVMVAFPYRALDTYLPKLVRAGKRVAICDQLEEPKLTKKHSNN